MKALLLEARMALLSIMVLTLAKPEDPHLKMHTYSSPQLNPRQMNHGRPMFHPLDAHSPHIDPQLNFMPPEGIIHHDGPSHPHFPENRDPPYLQSNNGLPEFDYPVGPMLQHMRMPNNFPLHRLHHGFPGVAPPPPHNSINSPTYIQESNPIQGLPFGQWQPNLGSLGMPLQGSQLGGLNNSPPEVFKRLLEMELRSNAKPMHPSFAADGGGARPMHGHELNAGFWYR